MRFRLFRRRMTISAPRMAVRSAMPWPVRWALLAVMLGFCAAIALWAFEFGRDIAGLDRGSQEVLQHLRTELAQAHSALDKLQAERDQAQSIANTAGTLVTTEKAAQDKLQEHVRQLEEENRSLRDDLVFFEKLIPTGSAEGVAIRGMQADAVDAHSLRWQVLVIQASRRAVEFDGRLEVSFTGTLGGKPWSLSPAGGSQPIKVRQYGRLEGVLEIPPLVVVKSMSARLVEGSTVRATQSIKLK